jgi:hypothetical protein
MSCMLKCPINPITNPKPFYSHTQSRDNIKMDLGRWVLLGLVLVLLPTDFTSLGVIRLFTKPFLCAAGTYLYIQNLLAVGCHALVSTLYSEGPMSSILSFQTGVLSNPHNGYTKPLNKRLPPAIRTARTDLLHTVLSHLKANNKHFSSAALVAKRNGKSHLSCADFLKTLNERWSSSVLITLNSS